MVGYMITYLVWCVDHRRPAALLGARRQTV